MFRLSTFGGLCLTGEDESRWYDATSLKAGLHASR
jgi:hypothetical protein